VRSWGCGKRERKDSVLSIQKHNKVMEELMVDSKRKGERAGVSGKGEKDIIIDSSMLMRCINLNL
jgi:hypothetical protein